MFIATLFITGTNCSKELIKPVISVKCGFRQKEGGGSVAKWCPALATLWTVVCQALLSMGFSRQEYWSGLPFPSPEAKGRGH